jgi:hypothetical protein
MSTVHSRKNLQKSRSKSTLRQGRSTSKSPQLNISSNDKKIISNENIFVN